ncbi:MAG: glycosyltransferase family 2 protein [Spirochaetes bacterium]|nr:glycosyltransferase family 2 protein [Spirochaetota bacterium]
MKNVTAIICAYNEIQRIEEVLSAVAVNGVFEEIVVVDDGSTDETWGIIQTFTRICGLTAVRLQENKGKGNAMAIGVEHAHGEILVFWDADLVGSREAHFLQLIEPILNGDADMVLGQADDTLVPYGVNVFRSLAGQRSLRKKDILPILEDMKTSKFGVEVLINLTFDSLGKRVKLVKLEDLNHPTKFEKTGRIQAIKEFANEGHHIAYTYISNLSLVVKATSKQFAKLMLRE